nr:YbaK/EbsC family protein [Chromobacterium paludis]
MLCRVADEAGLFVLAVLPGDERVDFAKVAAAVGARKVGLADAADAEAATGCVIGSIPPFSFHPSIRLVVDPQLLARYGEIAFNAGRLDAPMVLYSEDYRRLARPLLADIRKEQA